MIRVAICDLDAVFRKRLAESCERYFKNQGMECELRLYGSGEELLAEGYPDILCVNVRLKNIQGIFLKEILERVHCDTKVLFICENRNYMSEAFGRNVYGYLIKPLKEEALHKKLKLMLEDIEVEEQCVFGKIENRIERIRFKEIVYIEVVGRGTSVCVRKPGRELAVVTAEMNLKNWEALLAKEQYMRVNRRQLINFAYVIDKNRAIEMVEHIMISLGAGYEEKFEEKYYEYQQTRNVVYRIVRRGDKKSGGLCGGDSCD